MGSDVSYVEVAGGRLKVTVEFIPNSAKKEFKKELASDSSVYEKLAASITSLLSVDEAKKDVQPAIKKAKDCGLITDEQFETLKKQWNKRVDFLKDWMQSTRR